MTETNATQLEQGELETLIESKLKLQNQLSEVENKEQCEFEPIVAAITSKVAKEVIKELAIKDSPFLKELKTMVQSIDSAKSEIAAIRPKELAENELPNAANSLDIIIQTSEEACSNILGCAEELMEVAEYVPQKLNEKLMEISTRLFESSNFDDINGQRIQKVIKTLRSIEDRLKILLTSYGESYDIIDPKVKEEKAEAEGADLMNGPQEKDKASSQQEIDDILNSF